MFTAAQPGGIIIHLPSGTFICPSGHTSPPVPPKAKSSPEIFVYEEVPPSLTYFTLLSSLSNPPNPPKFSSLSKAS